MGQLVTLRPQSGHGERKMVLAHFLLLIQSGILVHRMVPPIFEVGGSSHPIHTNPEDFSQICPEVCLLGVSKSIRLTTAITYHRFSSLYLRRWLPLVASLYGPGKRAQSRCISHKRAKQTPHIQRWQGLGLTSMSQCRELDSFSHSFQRG